MRHLAQLAWFVGFVALTDWTVACGSSAPPDDASVTTFDGVYETESADHDTDIAVVGFANDRDYVLMTKACYDADCAERGTYDYDENAATLTFTDSASGARRVLGVEVLVADEMGEADALQIGVSLTKPATTPISSSGSTIVKTCKNAPASPASATGDACNIVKRKKKLAKKAKLRKKNGSQQVLNQSGGGGGGGVPGGGSPPGGGFPSIPSSSPPPPIFPPPSNNVDPVTVCRQISNDPTIARTEAQRQRLFVQCMVAALGQS